MSFADFFLCQAPFASYPPVVVTQLYHDGSPKFFGSILAVDLSEPEPVNFAGDNMPFFYHAPDGTTTLYIILLDKISDRLSPRLIEAFQQAALWYCTFLHRSAEAKSKYINWGLFEQHNILTPNLYIIELEDHQTWILSYPGGVKTFTDRKDMDTFLSKTLGYSEAQLERGAVNHMGIRAS